MGLDVVVDVGTYRPRDNQWFSDQTVTLSNFGGSSIQMVLYELKKKYERPGMRQEEFECVNAAGQKQPFDCMRSLEENGIKEGSELVLRIWNGKVRRQKGSVSAQRTPLTLSSWGEGDFLRQFSNSLP
jgi:hypothetical protein